MVITVVQSEYDIRIKRTLDNPSGIRWMASPARLIRMIDRQSVVSYALYSGPSDHHLIDHTRQVIWFRDPQRR
mgnify:CR=1 FL=1